MRTRLFLLGFLLLFSLPIFGQTFGEITGQVSDSTSAAIAGATITVTNTATNGTRVDAYHRSWSLQLPLAAARYNLHSVGEARLQNRYQQADRGAGATDGPPGFRITGRPGFRVGRSERQRLAIAGGERDRRHRDRQQGHRRASPQRTKLPEPGRAFAQHNDTLFAFRPSRLAAGRRPRQPVDLGRRAAHHV